MSRLPPRRALLRVLYWSLPALLYLWGFIQASHVSGNDLWPRPDAMEYAILAHRLAHFQPPLIPIGAHLYPSRYALTYPLLLVPFDWLGGGDLGRFYLGSAAFGLAATILMALVGARLAGSRAVGGLAASFFALHPATIIASTLNMSELADVMLCWAALGLALPWMERLSKGMAIPPGGWTEDSTPAGLEDSSKPPWVSPPAIHLRPRRGRAAFPKNPLDGGIETEAESNSKSESRTSGDVGRAALLGLTLGLLTLAKPPFGYWALALAALLALRARRTRRWGPLAACIAAGLACAAGDALYRRWAFGAWGINGYAYWAPEIYDFPARIFNWKYLSQPSLPNFSIGNVAFYSQYLTGASGEFYAPYAALVTLAAAILLAWPARRARPARRVTLLFAGWLATGALFCGFYFFQDNRFLLLWFPALDLLAAWGLMRLGTWPLLRRGLLGRAHAPRWGLALGIGAALLMARGEILRSAPARTSGGSYVALSTRIPALLRDVPAGDWLFTNYELPLAQFYRASPGPTGLLDTGTSYGKWFGGLALEALRLRLKPHGDDAAALALERDAPPDWRAGLPALLDSDARWTLDETTLARVVHPTAWLLIYAAQMPPLSDDFERVILPRLRQRLDIEPLAQDSDLILYRMTLDPAAAPVRD